MKINEILKYVNEHSNNKTRKLSIKNDSLVILHSDSWDWYKYIILLISILIIFFIFLKWVTLYSYDYLILNPITLSIIFVLIILFIWIYIYFQKPIIEFDFKNKNIIVSNDKISFADLKEIYYKKEFYLSIKSILKTKYILYLKAKNINDINIIEIDSEEATNKLIVFLKKIIN